MPSISGPVIRNRIIIVFLLQAVFYSVIWLWDEYVASYLTFIFPLVFLIILILAGIADWIEPSRIPGWYYLLMIASILIPLIIGLIFYFIYDGRIDWLL